MNDVLKILWDDLDKIISEESLTCKKAGGCDGKCCSSSSSGIQPTILPIEIQPIKNFLTTNNLIGVKNNIQKCRFLSEDYKCLIYEVRPIDCRAHFCLNDNHASTFNEKLSHKVASFFLDNNIDYEQRKFVSQISFK